MAQAGNSTGFLLLHGGGMEGWVWDRLREHLTYPSVSAARLPHAVDRDAATLEDSARHAWAEADAAGLGRVIVVAHSIAGILAPEVARLQPHRAAHLALVAANIPDEGKTALSVFGPATRWQMELGVRLAMWGMAPRGAMQAWMEEHLCHDLDAAAARRVLDDGLNQEPRAFFFEKISRRNLPPVPRTYVKLLQDRGLPPDVQDVMAANIGAQVVPLDCGHMAMLSRPKELAQILNALAAAHGDY